ncbi:MAG: type II toxin-antitoxin system VapC family toxin [Anaerolineae bacterium]|nr:type II toxin-antitoxin system VapC family toxin [Anaerolineae bacterium]
MFFFDSSALAKVYVVETGSPWVKSLLHPAAGNTAIISELAVVELSSLFNRRRREGTLTRTQVRRLLDTVFTHIEVKKYLVIPLDSRVCALAHDLPNRHPLRALDALQLASALQAAATLDAPVSFVSADNRLLTIAAAEGFTTDNPNAHP